MILGIIRVLVASTPAGIPGSRVRTGPENWHSAFPHLQHHAVKLATTTFLHVLQFNTYAIQKPSFDDIYKNEANKKTWLNTRKLECTKQSTSESCV